MKHSQISLMRNISKDRDDDQSRAGIFCTWPWQQWLHFQQGTQKTFCKTFWRGDTVSNDKGEEQTDVVCLWFYIIFGFQLDADGDGQLSLEEFKVLFDNAEKRKKDQKNSSGKASF